MGEFKERTGNLIERRKKNISLTGKPNTLYDVKLVRHEFPFGIVFGSNGFDLLKDLAGKLSCFSGFGFKNEFKWDSKKEPPSSDLNALEKYVLNRFRGHNIFWNRRRHLPEGLRGKSKEEIKKKVIERIDILRRYPQIKEWDLINEPIKQSEKSDIVFDPEDDIDLEFFADMIILAHRIKPDGKFYINEYFFGNEEKLERVIKFLENLFPKLEEKGLSKDKLKEFLGIGIQFHINSSNLIPLDLLKKQLEKMTSFAEQYGLPVKITELDVSGEISENVINYFEQVLTAFFANPNITGIYLWGLGLKEDKDYEKFSNPILNVYLRKIREEWTTKSTAQSYEDGKINFLGFPGDYKLEEIKN